MIMECQVPAAAVPVYARHAYQEEATAQAGKRVAADSSAALTIYVKQLVQQPQQRHCQRVALVQDNCALDMIGFSAPQVAIAHLLMSVPGLHAGITSI